MLVQAFRGYGGADDSASIAIGRDDKNPSENARNLEMSNNKGAENGLKVGSVLYTPLRGPNFSFCVYTFPRFHNCAHRPATPIIRSHALGTHRLGK